MQYLNKNIASYIAVLLTILLIISSCDEKGSITPPGEHFEAEGLVIKSSGITIAEIFQGETSDTLSVIKGNLSEHLNIIFYNHDKQEIAAPNNDEKKLAWEIDNPEILTIKQHEGEEGSFELHLKGLEIGITHIEFFIKHNDHNDYQSGKFPVKVTSK